MPRTLDFTSLESAILPPKNQRFTKNLQFYHLEPKILPAQSLDFTTPNLTFYLAWTCDFTSMEPTILPPRDFTPWAVFSSPQLLQTFQTFHHIETLNIANDPCIEY